MEVRKEIKEFAEEMERVMQEHDAEKGDSWKKRPSYFLIKVLLGKVEEFHYTESNYKAREEVVDIANYCMMLFHRYKED